LLYKIPEALTIEEEGLLMMRRETDDGIEVKGGVLEKLVGRLYHPASLAQGTLLPSLSTLLSETAEIN